jgi:sulfate transport system ATP-binding protein
VQSGHPLDLYDAPANEFVMRFLGPVTRVGDALVRPHDVELSRDPGSGAVPAVVSRVVRLGFEVRVELAVDGAAPAGASDGTGIVAQLTRGSAAQLGLREGDRVHVRATPGARALVPVG